MRYWRNQWQPGGSCSHEGFRLHAFLPWRSKLGGRTCLVPFSDEPVLLLRKAPQIGVPSPPAARCGGAALFHHEAVGHWVLRELDVLLSSLYHARRPCAAAFATDNHKHHLGIFLVWVELPRTSGAGAPHAPVQDRVIIGRSLTPLAANDGAVSFLAGMTGWQEK